MSTYTFITAAVETIRAIGAYAMSFFLELSRRVQLIPHEKRYVSFYTASHCGSVTWKFMWRLLLVQCNTLRTERNQSTFD
jgi:hypothetical protein